MNNDDLKRFWSRVATVDDGCWLWQGRIDSHGYGEFSVGSRESRRHLRAHRVAYESMHGVIPEGLVLDHLCRVRHCVNPDHLEPVTPGENIRRGDTGKATGAQKRAATHCKHGHEFTAENTYMRRGKWRVCRACASDRQARWLAK